MLKSTRQFLITFVLTFSSTTIFAASVSGSGTFNIHELVVINYAVDSSSDIPATREPKGDEIALTLDDLMDIAFLYNRMIEVVRQKVVQSQGQLIQVRSGYLAQLSVQGRYFHTERQDSALSASKINESIYPVMDKTEEDENVAAEEAHLKRQLQNVIYQVENAYYRVLEKMRLMEVAEQSVTNFEQHLSRAMVYYKAGVRTKIDVINAEFERSNARMSLLRAEYDLKLAKVELEQALGNKPNDGRYVLVSGKGEIDNVIDSMPPVPFRLQK